MLAASMSLEGRREMLDQRTIFHYVPLPSDLFRQSVTALSREDARAPIIDPSPTVKGRGRPLRNPSPSEDHHARGSRGPMRIE
jgi:hypothetical protein